MKRFSLLKGLMAKGLWQERQHSPSLVTFLSSSPVWSEEDVELQVLLL